MPITMQTTAETAGESLLIRRVANGWVITPYNPYVPGVGTPWEGTHIAMTPDGLGRQLKEWAEAQLPTPIKDLPKDFVPAADTVSVQVQTLGGGNGVKGFSSSDP